MIALLYEGCEVVPSNLLPPNGFAIYGEGDVLIAVGDTVRGATIQEEAAHLKAVKILAGERLVIAIRKAEENAKIK